MRSFTKEQLTEIIRLHGLWLMGEEGGIRANLSEVDFGSADLSSADLSSADLRSANLRSADLSYANLSYANLRYADLRSADLSSANLSEIHLNFAIGESNFVKSMQIETYLITYTATRLFIGCQSHLIAEWKEFNDDVISEMDGKRALDFWAKWKEIIFKIIEMSPAQASKESDEEKSE